MCPNQDDEKQLEDQDCTNCSNMARAIFSQMWKNLTMKGIKVSQSNMNYAKDGSFPVVRATCCVGGLDMLQLHIMLCYLNRATRRSLWDQSVDSKLGLTMLIKGDVSKAVVIISHYKPLLPTQSILSYYNTTHSYFLLHHEVLSCRCCFPCSCRYGFCCSFHQLQQDCHWYVIGYAYICSVLFFVD